MHFFILNNNQQLYIRPSPPARQNRKSLVGYLELLLSQTLLVIAS